MSIVRECVTCRIKLRLPESGIGRCPKCKEIIRIETTSVAQVAVGEELIPEISEEHEVTVPAYIASSSLLPHVAEPEPLPPPLPRPRRRERDPLPGIDIANPPERPSRVPAVVMLASVFALSFIAVVGSFWYLVHQARNRVPNVPPPVFVPRR